MSDLRESSRQLAEGVSSTLSDQERASAQNTAALIVADFRETCSTGTPDEIACTISQAVTSMLATLQSTPLQTVVPLMEHNMCAYAMAAGALAGVYALPDVEVSEPQFAEPIELSDAWKHTGQYL